MKPTTRTVTITLAIAAIATGCQDDRPAKDPEVCRDNCQLTISLPEDATQPPRSSSEHMHLAAGGEFDILLEGGAPGQQATELRFDRSGDQESSGTPFVNRNGQPVYQVRLNPGSNRLQLRPWDDGVCHPPEGCKYDIVNTGTPGRPSQDPWIILYQ